MKTITIDLLNNFGACSEGIDFFRRNKLEGFPLNKLDEVKGDHKSFLIFLKNKLSIIHKIDNNGNIIYKRYANGEEYIMNMIIIII